jgi:hypothetical protein
VRSDHRPGLIAHDEARVAQRHEQIEMSA